MSSRHLSLLYACLAVAPLRALAQSECDPPSSGPDAIVGEVAGLQFWGTIGDISAWSIGADVCNVGDSPLPWRIGIAQNMYRLHGGRFEQIGMSWVKKVSIAASDSTCCTCIPSGSFGVLGVGCSDLYSATINGSQQSLGPRSMTDAFAGFVPDPTGGAGLSVVERRLQIRQTDLSADQYPEVRFFQEVQLVGPDDADAGNALNNVSYKEWVAGPGMTVRRQPAIFAWSTSDSTVTIVPVDVPGEGRFFLGYRVSNIGQGAWSYEYALYNLNSHRSARSLRVPASPILAVSGVGFHDVDYHSGEPYDLTDWPGVHAGGAVTWSTDPFAVNENANALRWGTLYNFRFDASAPPVLAEATIGLFRPGDPPSVSVVIAVPAAPIPAMSPMALLAFSVLIAVFGAAIVHRHRHA